MGRSAASVSRTILVVVLTLFFLVGGVANAIGPTVVQADYARWGFPSWFHYVTSALEISAACLLPLARSRFLGLALASVVMLAAVATVLYFHEVLHAGAPGTVLLLIALLAWLNRPSSVARTSQARAEQADPR